MPDNGKPIAGHDQFWAGQQPGDKAVELFEPQLFTANKPAHARGPIIQLALASLDVLKKSGGRICYYGVEKQDVLPPSHGHGHSDSILQRTCLRRAIEPIKREVQRQNVPCVIVVDHHSSHHKHADIIAYSMAADGYFEQLREPPMMAHSRLSTAIQVADWIAGLLNKVFISETKKAFEWPDIAPYAPRFKKILTDGALPASRVALRP